MISKNCLSFQALLNEGLKTICYLLYPFTSLSFFQGDVYFPNHAAAFRQPKHNSSIMWKLDCFHKSENGAVRFDRASYNHAIRDWTHEI